MEEVEHRPLVVILGAEDLDELRKRELLERMAERGVSPHVIAHRRAILNRRGF